MIVRHNDLFYTGIAYRNPQQRPFGNSIVILSLFKQPFPPGKYWISIEILDDIRQRDQIIELKEIEFSRCCICDTDFFFLLVRSMFWSEKGYENEFEFSVKCTARPARPHFSDCYSCFQKMWFENYFKRKTNLNLKKCRTEFKSVFRILIALSRRTNWPTKYRFNMLGCYVCQYVIDL